MNFVSTKKRTYKLVEEQVEILELAYKNWYSSQASTIIDGIEISIAPKNIWVMKFEIRKNGEVCGGIIFNWKNHAKISLYNHPDFDGKRSWVLKNVSMWLNKFQLADENEDFVLSLSPILKWKKMRRDFKVELSDAEDITGLELELLAYCCFAANRILQSSGH